LFAIRPEPFPENRALLVFYSIVSDPDVAVAETAEMLAWVNQSNANSWLGSPHIANGRFNYDFSVPGECVNQESLQLLGRGFASISAKLANEVRENFE